MKIILLKNLPHLGGQAGDIKDVAPSYARQVLLKSGQALVANPENIKNLAQQRSQTAKNKIRQQAEQKKFAYHLANATLTLKTRANAQGRLFAGLDEKNITDALYSQLGLKLDPKTIKLNEPIKKIGEHQINYVLNPDLRGTFKLLVKPESTPS